MLNNMQRENKWQDRFDEEFLKVGGDRYIVVESYGEAFIETIERIKSFIQSEIDTAIAEERSRIVKEVESIKISPGTSPDFIVDVVLEIINLITKKQ